MVFIFRLPSRGGYRRPVRVAIAQEWIIKRGGSERVVESMRTAFPGATVLTTLLDARGRAAPR